MKMTNRFRKLSSISQIFILMLGIFAFGFLIGGEFKIVSARTTCPDGTTKITDSDSCPTGYLCCINGDQTVSVYQLSSSTSSSAPEPPVGSYSRDSSGEVVAEVSESVNSEDATNILTQLMSGVDTIDSYVGGYEKVSSWIDKLGGESGSPATLNTPTNVNSGSSVVDQANELADDIVKKNGAETNANAGEEDLSIFEQIFAIQGKDALDILGASAAWGVTAYFAGSLVGGMLGLSEKNTQALSFAMGAAAFVGEGVYGLVNYYGDSATAAGGGTLWGYSAQTVGIVSGLVVGAAIFLAMYGEEESETIYFTCEPWQAPVGGEDCEKCNEGGLTCSEYQCKSLGQACELLNPDNPEEAQCAWVNRHDTEYPIITPWEEVLTTDHVYTPDDAISPPDSGVQIVLSNSSDGCIQAFTPLEFGITLSEPGQCKLDSLRKNNFEEMDYYFGGSSLFKYNHSQIMSLPGSSALSAENLTIQNDGNYALYVRCMDANGNYNSANFVFKYCVDEGPDTTPPLIVTTSILNGQPVAFNQSSVDIELYINEPANCKWSRLDQSYEDMENQMVCSTSVLEMNAQMLYECSTTLDGIANRENNTYYFRCEDQPSVAENDRNVNQESYEFVLGGSQPLVISDVGPNGTVKNATDPVKVTLEVETIAGWNEGNSICYYSSNGNEDTYIEFYNTNSYEHSQDLYLAEGNYGYFIKCVDLGGNTDYNYTEFYVDSDKEAPLVVRAYHEENYLKLVTNEEDSECVYDTTDCSYEFEEGVAMTSLSNGKNHYTDWDVDTDLYIKCKDIYGNQPDPNECSIVVKPAEL